MKQLKLSITGEINLKTYEEVLLNVSKAPNNFEEIILIINSSGSSVEQGFAIGNCLIIATLLFSLGSKKRYISENTNYMLHQVCTHFYNDISYNYSDLKDLLKGTLNYNEKKALLKTAPNQKAFLDSIFTILVILFYKSFNF